MKTFYFHSLLVFGAISLFSSPIAAQEDTRTTRATIQFEKADRDKDGKIDRREAADFETKDGPLVQFFWDIDIDKVGYISDEEFNTWGMHRNWESEQYDRRPGLVFMRVLF